MSACGVTPNTGPAPRRTRRTFAVCRPLGVIPTALPLLPFTAIRSSFWVSVRPSGPFSPLTGEERRCCGQRPHRCRGIWRPPGRACPVGQYSAGRAVPSQQPAGGSSPSGRACGLCTSRRPRPHIAVTVFLVSGRVGRWAGSCGWGRGPAGLPDHGRAAKIRSGLWPGPRASATPAARMV